MITPRLVALLVEALASALTHAKLDTFLMRVNLHGYGRRGKMISKEAILNSVMTDIRHRHEAPGEAEKIYFSIIKEFLESYVPNECSSNFIDLDIPASNKAKELLVELKSNGWEYRDKKLIPTTAGPAELEPQITGLERDLEALGLTVALTHYKQAVENFSNRNHESSNGQLRSFLENLYIELTARKVGRKFEDATGAIHALQQAGFLDAGEFNLARGMFEASNERGAHHGLSNEEEALFRFHFSTALGRYLLARLR